MSSLNDFWPESVPRSLWQYGLLVPASRRAFPFVGIEVSWEFVAAFVAGTALICVFAWRRFSEPSFDVNVQAFHGFRELTIWNLKDSVSLRRAYVVYCISLVAIYATLAFFGRVIVQLLDQFKVSGLQVSVGTVQFDSWQWPLFLALGIAGFAPLINPLVPAELWLRRFSHGVVGIPTRLRETSIRLKTLIDGAPSEARKPKVPDWVEAALGPKLTGYAVLKENLERVVEWSYQEHIEWSDPEIRWKLNEYERRVRDETEAATAEFDYLVGQPQPARGDAKDRQSQLKALEKRLFDCTHQLEKARDRFSLIMAIYCESGRTRFDKMKQSELKTNLGNNLDAAGEMPAIGLPLYGFLIIFIAYFLAVSSWWHPLISAVPLSNASALTTAALESLKIFLLIWLPVAAVATFRSVMDRPGSTQESAMIWGTVPGALTAFVVAAFGMSLFAVLYSALPAENTTQMRQSLFGLGAFNGALSYYLLFAPVAIVCFLGVDAVRAAGRRLGFLPRLGLAGATMAATVVYLAFVVSTKTFECSRNVDPNVAEPVSVSLWQVLRIAHPRYAMQLQDFKVCFTNYSTLDIVVAALAAFFSVLGLGAQSSRRRRARRRVVASPFPLAGGVAAGCLLLVMAAPVFAASRNGPVYLGFRGDIPPFSSRTDENPLAPYQGYVAELCYEIFEDSGYVTRAVPVDVQSRFEIIRRPFGAGEARDYWPRPGEAEPVDVLCDATTVRIDDEYRVRAGVFSPIIFVSGVSYLSRSRRSFRDVEIGYVKNSTAVRVAKEACTVDFLRLGSTGSAPGCFEAGLVSDCQPPKAVVADVASSETKDTRKDETLSLESLATNVPDYVLCPKAGHEELIEWFCGDTERDKVYIGDRDIILGKLDEWLARGSRCDDVRDSNQTFTYEPYALLISKADQELVAFVQRRVYELFSHRSGAEALFYKWFGTDTKMSEPLAWLFVLNGVLDEDELLNGEKGFGDIRQDRCVIKKRDTIDSPECVSIPQG